MTHSDHLDTADQVFDYLMVPSPLRDRLLPASRRLHAASTDLGASTHADLIRMDVCHRIRLGQDVVFAGEGDPVPGYRTLLEAAADGMRLQTRLPITRTPERADADHGGVMRRTASHYERLWEAFSPERYFDEAADLLLTRLTRNGIDVDWLTGKRALDCGCGGGRYTVALRRLGCAQVV